MTKFSTCVSVRDAQTSAHAKIVAKLAGWSCDAGTVAERMFAMPTHRAKLAAGEYEVAKRRGYWLCTMEVRS